MRLLAFWSRAPTPNPDHFSGPPSIRARFWLEAHLSQVVDGRRFENRTIIISQAVSFLKGHIWPRHHNDPGPCMPASSMVRPCKLAACLARFASFGRYNRPTITRTCTQYGVRK